MFSDLPIDMIEKTKKEAEESYRRFYKLVEVIFSVTPSIFKYWCTFIFITYVNDGSGHHHLYIILVIVYLYFEYLFIFTIVQ